MMKRLQPARRRRTVMSLPQFVRVLYRLMADRRVPRIAKLIPLLGLLLLVSPPALELDFFPPAGLLSWLIVGYLSLQIFIGMCPSLVVREHKAAVARDA
jgi:uncharacterized membrane protein YkvA (DUF1232 family)